MDSDLFESDSPIEDTNIKSSLRNRNRNQQRSDEKGTFYFLILIITLITIIIIRNRRGNARGAEREGIDGDQQGVEEVDWKGFLK